MASDAKLRQVDYEQRPVLIIQRLFHVLYACFVLLIKLFQSLTIFDRYQASVTVKDIKDIIEQRYKLPILSMRRRVRLCHTYRTAWRRETHIYVKVKTKRDSYVVFSVLPWKSIWIRLPHCCHGNFNLLYHAIVQIISAQVLQHI